MSANRSLVWKYFTPSEDGSTAKCTVCCKDLKRSGANTTNLMVHLERQHRREHQELKEEDKRRKMQNTATDEVYAYRLYCGAMQSIGYDKQYCAKYTENSNGVTLTGALTTTGGLDKDGD